MPPPARRSTPARIAGYRRVDSETPDRARATESRDDLAEYLPLLAGTSVSELTMEDTGTVHHIRSARGASSGPTTVE